MSITAQVLTLVAVVVGAITSFIAASLNDRRRLKQDQTQHWLDQKLEAYIDYLDSVKQMNQVSRRIAASRGIGRRAFQLQSEDALQLLAEAEARRVNAGERVTLIGEAATVAAVRDLNKEVWRLEWIARGKLDPDHDAWEACNQSLVRALNRLHERIRAELHIPGTFLPREVGEPYQPTLPVPGAP